MNTWPPETCQITAACVVTPEAQPPREVTHSRTLHRTAPPPRPRGCVLALFSFILFCCFSALPHTDWTGSRRRRRAADKKPLSDGPNLQSGKCGNWPSAFLKICDYVAFKLTSGVSGRTHCQTLEKKQKIRKKNKKTSGWHFCSSGSRGRSWPICLLSRVVTGNSVVPDEFLAFELPAVITGHRSSPRACSSPPHALPRPPQLEGNHLGYCCWI